MAEVYTEYQQTSVQQGRNKFFFLINQSKNFKESYNKKKEISNNKFHPSLV